MGCSPCCSRVRHLSQAEESNPNNYNCLGSLAAGQPEAGSEEQQVSYTLLLQRPDHRLPGAVADSRDGRLRARRKSPTSNENGRCADTFSCSGEVPGWAVNCVGAAKAGYETITGQFAIGTKLCAEPRVDPLLTVTYAYLEKGVGHAGDLRAVRPRPPERLQARRLLGLQPLQPQAADRQEAGQEGARSTQQEEGRRQEEVAPARRHRPARGGVAPRAAPPLRFMRATCSERRHRSPAPARGAAARRAGDPRPRCALAACGVLAVTRSGAASRTANAPVAGSAAGSRHAPLPGTSRPRRSARSARASTTRPRPAATSSRRSAASRRSSRARRRRSPPATPRAARAALAGLLREPDRPHRDPQGGHVLRQRRHGPGDRARARRARRAPTPSFLLSTQSAGSYLNVVTRR